MSTTLFVLRSNWMPTDRQTNPEYITRKPIISSISLIKSLISDILMSSVWACLLVGLWNVSYSPLLFVLV